MSRKITVESIKHLGQHTDLIQDIDKKTGKITPSKILNIHKEETLDTYENWFVNTLIDRLYIFINIRYNKLVQTAEAQEAYSFNYDTVADSGDGRKVNISFKIETVDSLVGGSKDTDVWARLERVKKAIEGYKGSVLCTTLGNALRRVLPLGSLSKATIRQATRSTFLIPHKDLMILISRIYMVWPQWTICFSAHIPMGQTSLRR